MARAVAKAIGAGTEKECARANGILLGRFK